MDLSKRMTPMETPKTRIQMERNSHIFKETLMQGRLSLPNDSMIKYSIMKLSFTPNRRLDFLSVDELSRLQMNMAGQDFFNAQLSQFDDKALVDNNNDTSNGS